MVCRCTRPSFEISRLALEILNSSFAVNFLLASCGSSRWDERFLFLVGRRVILRAVFFAACQCQWSTAYLQ
jgi:hypothetical protein